jgi:arsenate reductase (glutaredoxin)
MPDRSPTLPHGSKEGVVLYGIANCDQVRRARAWLLKNGVAYEFHDYKTAGVSHELLEKWFSHLPWDALLNRRGTTWRKLSDIVRADVVDQQSATELMLQQPSLIKRPVLRVGPHILVGFVEASYQSALINSAKPI